MTRYLYGHSTARAVTIGPGDFDPPDDDPYEEPTETVYRLDRVVQRHGIAVGRYTAVEVDPETHEIRRYTHRHHCAIRWINGWPRWRLGGPDFHNAVEWCRRQAKKRGGRMPRVWERLVELATLNGHTLEK